jgi:hypothetical protein
MKQIFTLLATALLASFASNAQLTENFENGLAPLTSNCWLMNGISVEAASPTGKGITGQSIASSESTNSGFATPYFDFQTTNLVNVSFKIAIDKPLANQASRTIVIGTKDKNGVVAIHATYTYTKNTLKISDLFTLTANNISVSGTKRIFVDFNKDGDGNTHIILDELNITGTLPFHYAPSACNTAPIAGNDNFITFTSLPYSNDVISGSDFDVNAGETLSASVVTQPAATVGSVSMNADGTFTFTPAVGFRGGAVSFTYTVTDNGYDPLSATATVTIVYPELAPLPVHLISFNGNLSNDKAQLTWLVAGNETGDHFEIERSDDGKSFTTEAYVLTTKKFASETYIYKSSKILATQTYYRIKIINKDGSVDHSRTIVLKTAKAGNNNKLVILQNPVESTLMFQYTSTASTKGIVNIYNTSGARMLTTGINIQTGMNAASINLDGKFNSGTYLLEVINGAERTVSKLIKK